MYLIINSCHDDYVEVLLAKNVEDYKIKKINGEQRQAEKLLICIEEILKKNKITEKKISGIGVVVGPGSFTSVRIGVVIANTLAFAWKKSVVGLKADQFVDQNDLIAKIIQQFEAGKSKTAVLPYYDREPNITIKK